MRGVVRILLLAFVFAIPWEYSLDLGEPFGNIARIAGLVVLAAAIPAILLAGGLRTPGVLQWLVLAAFIWFCCTSFWTIDDAATLARLRGYFQVMMPVWLIWEFAETPEDLRDLLRAYVAGSWVLAVLTVASLASGDAATQVRFAAEGQDPNDVARFLDLGLPMTVLLLDGESRLAWKVVALGYLPMGLIGVLLTASRGGFVAAVIAVGGCGLLIARHRRSFLAGAASLPVIAAAFWWLVPHETILRLGTIPQQLQRGDLNQRLNIWSAGWQAFAHAPFFGSGAGTFVQAAHLASGDTAHNTALTVLVEGGVAGLILASAVLAQCSRSIGATRGSVRVALGTAFLVWVVTSLVATVEANRTTWLLMGLLSVAGRLGEESPERLEACFSRVTRERVLEAAGESA